MIIITNNPKVKDELPNLSVFYEDIDYIGVLKKCRDLIHEGNELLSHPLYGSIKPNETPYRTVILKKGSILNMESLSLIEKAITTAEKFQKCKKMPRWSESVINDFQVIDFDIFYNTLQRIQSC